MSDLDDEEQTLRERLDEISTIKRSEKKAKYPTKCCRCWPSVVSDDGFCGCCLYNHKTSERLERFDPW